MRLPESIFLQTVTGDYPPDTDKAMSPAEIDITLKADPKTKDIPVILLSAKGRNVDQKVGFEVGADDYITKPFSPRKLVERINTILGQSSHHRMQA